MNETSKSDTQADHAGPADGEDANGIVREIAERLAPPGTLVGPDTVLGAGGLEFDSIRCLELLLAVEQRAGIRLRDEDLTSEALRSVSSLARHLQRKKGA